MVGNAVGILERQQRSGVSGGDATLGEQLAGTLRQADEPKRVGDMAAALADDLRNLGVRIAIVRSELGVAGGLLEGVEICPLDVFDDSELKRLLLSDLEHEDRDVRLPCPSSGAPSAFACDDFVAVRSVWDCPDQDRLENAAGTDRLCKFVEFGLVKMLSRVPEIGAEKLDREAPKTLPDSRRRRSIRRRPKKRSEAAPKTWPDFVRSDEFFRHQFSPRKHEQFSDTGRANSESTNRERECHISEGVGSAQ